MNQYQRSPLIMTTLEFAAKACARGDESGVAKEGDVYVRYPRSRRYAWFNQYGPISKRYATELLVKEGCI